MGTYLVIGRDENDDDWDVAAPVEVTSPEQAVKRSGFDKYRYYRVYEMATDEDGEAVYYTIQDLDL